MMKNLIVVSVAFLIGLGSFSARAADASAKVSDVKASEVSLPWGKLYLLPSLPIVAGSVGYGALFNFQVRLVDALSFSFESGFLTYTQDLTKALGVNRKINTVPLMFGLVYSFEQGAIVKPYVGLGAGISGNWGQDKSPAKTVELASSEPFQFWARVGTELNVAPAISVLVETKAGVQGSDFLFIPQVGLGFRF